MANDERVPGCPCGLTGESCDILEEGVDSIEGVLEENCFASGFDRCFVFQGEASCICKCGHTGDLCEERLSPEIYNFILGPVAVVCFMILLWKLTLSNYRKSKANESVSEYDWPKEVFVTSDFESITPKRLLFWRAACAFFYWPVLINGLARAGLRIFLAFTWLNWTVFAVIFSIGTYLSYQKVQGKTNEEEKAGRLENLFLILLEVELPATLLIALVVWTVLLPENIANDNEDEVLNFNSYVTHGGNTLLLFIEMYINRLHFNYSHYTYMLLWGCVYLLYHIFVMMIKALIDYDHCPVYGFLGMATPLFVVFVLGLLLGFVFFYNLTYQIMKCKKNKRNYTYQLVSNTQVESKKEAEENTL